MSLAFDPLSASCVALRFALRLRPAASRFRWWCLERSDRRPIPPQHRRCRKRPPAGSTPVSAALFVLEFPPATTIVGWNLSGAPTSTQSLLAGFHRSFGQGTFIRRIDHLLRRAEMQTPSAGVVLMIVAWKG
jgi:hypothetical protein